MHELYPHPQPRRDATFGLALLAAVLAHAALAAAWLWTRAPATGDGGTRLEAITVELVDGAALEATRSSAASAAATRTEAPDAIDGSATATASAATTADTPRPPDVEQEPPIPSSPTGPAPAAPPVDAETRVPVQAPAAADDQAILPADVAPPPPALEHGSTTRLPGPLETMRPDTASEHASSSISSKSTRAPPSLASAGSTAGGAASRADVATPGPSPAASGAPPGVVADYGRMVARALSRTRPAGLGTAGDVRIAFTVAPDGAPARLRIVEARGPERLSAAALAAVRRTRFAPPPAGMSERQRTFEVPYRFR